MDEPQQSLQDEARIIATLLKQHFDPQGVVVKLNLKENCLRILLAAPEVPEPSGCVAAVKQLLRSHQPQGFQSVQLYGRRIGTADFAWRQEIQLEPNPSDPAPMPEKQLRQQAKQGDQAALTALLNQSLSHKQITVQLNLQNGCLEVNLQSSDPILEGEVAMTLIDRTLVKVASPVIQQVRVLGQASEISGEPLDKTFAVGSHSQLKPHPPLPPPLSPPPPPQLLLRLPDKAGKRSLGIGFILAILILISPFSFLLRGFQVFSHELGHALTHWLFGRPAIPSVDLVFGGGVTIVFAQSKLMITLIYLAIVALCLFCRFYPWLLGILSGVTLFYSFCLLTPWNEILSTAMGHGMEWIAIVVCLYLGVSGYFCRFPGDRIIYSLLGFFTWFVDLRFCWQLLHNPEIQAWYEEGKGGLIDNDLVILAGEYFKVDLSVVVNGFFLLYGVAPVVALLLFLFDPEIRQMITRILTPRASRPA